MEQKELLVEPAGKPVTGDLPTVAFIERSFLFKPLDEDQRRMMIEAATLVACKPGQIIIQEGEDGDSFYLIKRGTVSITTEREAARIQLALLSRGAFFGEVVLFTEGKRTATVTAVEPVEVIRFDAVLMRKAMETSPKLKSLLKTVLEGRARDTIKKTVG